MSTSPEKLRILKLIQQGKITPEEGIELLEMLNKPGKGKHSQELSEPAKPAAQWFRVVVTDTTTGKTRVNVRLPISLVNAGMKMGAKFSPQIEGLNQDQLAEFIKTGETGKVIDVFDDDDGERVEVYIE